MENEGRAPDTKPGAYYVSAVDGGRYALLLGPFANDHAAALAMVEPVRAKACELNPRAHWYAFGTCRLPPEVEAKPGRLNDYFLGAAA